jgi:hypothetical protein
MRLPVRAKMAIIAVAAAGAVAAALRIPDLFRWHGGDAAAFIGLAVAVGITEQFAVRYRYRTETWNFSLTDAVFVAGLMLARPSVLTMAVMTGTLAAHAIRWRNPYKVAFNVGQFAIGMTAAELVYRIVPTHSVAQPMALALAVAGMGAFFLANAGAVAMIISVVEGKRFTEVLKSPLTLNLLHWAGNVAIGIVGAVVWHEQPGAVLLLAVPLAISYLAYRGMYHGLLRRDRAQAAATG